MIENKKTQTLRSGFKCGTSIDGHQINMHESKIEKAQCFLVKTCLILEDSTRVVSMYQPFKAIIID